MSKIKYVAYGKFDDRTIYRRLYTYKIPMIGVIGMMYLISAALFIMTVVGWETGTGNEVSIGLLIAAGTLLLVTAFVNLIAIDASNAKRVIGFWVYPNAKKLPKDFDPAYINSSYYQEALKEHMAGKDIGSLNALNKAIGKQTDSDVKSDIVSRLAAIAADEAEFMKLIGPKDAI